MKYAFNTQHFLVALAVSGAAPTRNADWFISGAECFLEDHCEPAWQRARRLASAKRPKTLPAVLAVADAILDGPTPEQESAWRGGYDWGMAHADCEVQS